jgi:Carboxypeptidase regulatory-like domain
MLDMKKMLLGVVVGLTILAITPAVAAQKDKEEDEIGPTSWLNFLVVKDDNGKPVRNAAVIMHPVDPKGKQERGGMELKTDVDGKAEFNGIPYGMLRVQVLAQGFQTYGQDFDIDKPKVELTIKLKRPQHQYSIYGNQPADPNAPPQPNSSPDQKKPN